MLENLEFINFPSQRPSEWPFPSWMSPKEWELMCTPLAWSSFQTLDAVLEVWFRKDVLPVKSIIFGFEEDSKSPARIVLRGTTAFIGIDWRIFLQGVIIGTYFSKSIIVNTDGIKPESSSGDLMVAFGKASKLWDKSNTDSIILSAGLLINFIIHHELNHLISGHLEIIKDHTRKKELISAMEFCADFNALQNSFLPLMMPGLDDDYDISEIDRASKTFGFILTIFYALRQNFYTTKESLYPSFYERLLVILGLVLVTCQKGDSFAQNIANLVKRGLMEGVFSGLSTATDLKLIDKSKNIVSFIDKECQRKNCLSCNTFARKVYFASVPLIKNTLSNEQILSRYTKNFHGFNLKDFDMEKLYNNRVHTCLFQQTGWQRFIGTVIKGAKNLVSKDYYFRK